jgi:small subunit ribosomal protein S9
MDEQQETTTPDEGDNAMAQAVAAAMGGSVDGATAVADTDADGEEVVVEIDPTGRLVEPAKNGFHWGTGRRKDARARVRIRPGTGVFQINGKDSSDFFPREVDQKAIAGPLESLKVLKKVDVFVNAEGGGITGQAGAVRMGLGRALEALYPDAHQVLRDDGHLSRDARMVERKKPGRHGARRGHQWGKR